MLLWGRMVSDSGSILVIDDHPRIRAGLVRLVEELGHTAVEADSLETGLELLERAPFRLVLLDLLLPGMHGFDGLRVIHERFSDTPVVVISGTATVELAVACMKRGARDVIPKPFDPDVALELIRAALEPTSAAYVRNDNRPERARDAARRATHSWALSPRQAEVLELLVTGASNRTIADSLKCAESTVEMHVTTLLKKSSTVNALNWWHGFGWSLARSGCAQGLFSAVCARSMISGRVRVPDIMTSESLTALVGCGVTTTSGHRRHPCSTRVEIGDRECAAISFDQLMTAV